MQAIILAGGRGERMRPFTDTVPKPMVPIKGKPLISHQLDQLRRNGITDVAIYESYLAEVVQNYLGDGSNFGISVEHRIREFGIGSLGCIKDALAQLPEGQEDLLVMYGDNFSDINLRGMIDERRKHDAFGTLSYLEVKDRYGLVTIEGGEIVKFEEKPVHNRVLGVYVAAKALGRHMPDTGDFSKDGLSPLINNSPKTTEDLPFKFSRWEHHGYWWDVSSSEVVREIEEEIDEGRIRLEGSFSHGSPERR